MGQEDFLFVLIPAITTASHGWTLLPSIWLSEILAISEIGLTSQA